MAHFYLHVRDGADLVRDPTAYVFRSAAEAREAAVAAMRDLLRARRQNFTRKQIEIADATGHPVSVVHAYDVAAA